MPWPMVHFAIADRVCCGEPSPSFLIGSIAPDAIHARAGSTREDKERTHFVQNGTLPTVDEIGRQAAHFFHQDEAPEWKAFVRGYMSHVYAGVRAFISETSKELMALYSEWGIDFSAEVHA
ncbi:hypothetical protein ACFFK0_17060 [Paenibacillus chartarius]|uniref:Uncharacterized protein n=1 Tax=Paenibacillus chartarius TaxID=747481 RepID=A0ABV6DNC1_9BACL